LKENNFAAQSNNGKMYIILSDASKINEYGSIDNETIFFLTEEDISIVVFYVKVHVIKTTFDIDN
jgi:hypothetical protein